MSKFKQITKKVGSDFYTFRLGFETVRRLQDDQGQPAFAMAQKFVFDKASVTPADLLNVIMSSIECVNNKNIRNDDVEQASIDFIDNAGFAVALEICNEIFVWGQIGNVEKKRIAAATMMSKAADQYLYSLWGNSAKAGLLWALTLAISTTLTCSILTIL